MADKIKLILAAFILIGGIVAYYLFSDQLMVLRVLGVLVAAGIAIAVAKQTEAGGRAFDFGRGAIVEVRKVVWPSRKETTQTTLIVMVMVIIVGLILWGFDSVLAWGIRLLTGQGS